MLTIWSQYVWLCIPHIAMTFCTRLFHEIAQLCKCVYSLLPSSCKRAENWSKSCKQLLPDMHGNDHIGRPNICIIKKKNILRLSIYQNTTFTALVTALLQNYVLRMIFLEKQSKKRYWISFFFKGGVILSWSCKQLSWITGFPWYNQTLH